MDSAPGSRGDIRLGSKFVTTGVSVSLGPTLCAKAGPAHTPAKLGLPWGIRGMLPAGALVWATSITAEKAHAIAIPVLTLDLLLLLSAIGSWRCQFGWTQRLILSN